MRFNLKRFKHQTKTLIAFVLAVAVPTASAIPTYQINSHYQSTQNTSGLQAGDGGFNVNVKGNTKLIGGVISSTQAAVDNKQNQYNTGTLTLQDLNNQAAYDSYK